MRRDPRALVGPEFDLLLIGGGIFGACAAWDAAQRGLSVALIEMGDFAHATSSNHFRVIHGGVRYLQHGDLIRVRESSRERAALLRIAPHLVAPLPILVPTYGHGRRGKALLRAGFAAYDLLTLDKNLGLVDPERRLPSSGAVSRERALGWFPELPQDGLTGGVVFCDGQIHNPARLTLAFVRSAVDTGATQAANYVAARRFLRDGSRIVGVEAEDVLGGERFPIRSRVVLNATGPWVANLLLEGLHLDLGPRTPTFSRDLALLTRRRLHRTVGLACPTGSSDADAVFDRGARHLFLLPWQGLTLVGVWHKVYPGPPEHIRVEADELLSFIEEANAAYPGLGIQPDDICDVLTGLVLFGDREQESTAHQFGKRSLLIDHEEEHGVSGLISLVGVRATVARRMAEEAINLVLRKLRRPGKKCRTQQIPIHGGDIAKFGDLLSSVQADAPELTRPEVRKALAHNHGSEYCQVLAKGRSDPELSGTVGRSTVLKAEIAYAACEEMAVTLEDVVVRRTDLATGRRPANEELLLCAQIMGRQLGWSHDTVRAEVAAVRKVIEVRSRPYLAASGTETAR